MLFLGVPAEAVGLCGTRYQGTNSRAISPTIPNAHSGAAGLLCDQLETPKKSRKTAEPAKEERQNLMPLLYKWLELKKEHSEDITLLQDNEEYVTFGQQAEDTADILKLKLTKAKGCSYAAFPADKINDYMHLFIKAGKTIALCNNPL